MTPATRSAGRGSPRHPAGPGGGVISAGEWVVAALGVVLLVACLVVLLRAAVNGPQSPPDITVRVGTPRRVTGGWLVRYEAENAGDETAADVQLLAELRAGDRVIERADATLDFLPGRSRRAGGIFLVRDPAAATLHVRAVSYQEP